jgi:hypothetical protein
LTDIVESERRSEADRRAGDRRQAAVAIMHEDRRSGEDRRLAQRRLDYDRAVDAAKAALVSCGMDSPEFAMAAKESEQARQRLDDIGGLHNAARR